MAANRWPPEGWEVLRDDDDFIIARTWRTEGGTEMVHIIRVTDMDAACGRDNEGHPPYVVELLELEPETAPPSVVKSALDCVGMEPHQWGDLSPEWKAEVLMSYGAYAPLGTDSAKAGYRAAVRRLVRESFDISGNPAVHDYRMSLPVNKIGSTAKEYMRGDLNAAMERWKECDFHGPCVQKELKEAAGIPTDTKEGSFGAGLSFVERRVSQKKMSPECWSVQVWGLQHCQKCEFRCKPSCGGKEIRKTGKNSNGFKVPLKEGAEYDDGSEGADRASTG